jgi:protease-4
MTTATPPIEASMLPALGPVMALWAAGMPAAGPFTLSLPLAAADDRPFASRPTFNRLPEGVAVIDVRGLLVKDPNILTDLGLASSVMDIARQVQTAADDPRVRAILLAIDSPGGSAAGTAEAAAVIRAAARRKLVHAHIEAIGASAAYRLASQAGSISAATDALVGSIGTYSVVADLSRLADRLGITIHVLRAGRFKGAGVPGTVVTDEQLADFQRTVEAINETFLADVAAGRKLPMPRVRELADGRVHVGESARQLQLIDMVIPTTDQVLTMIDRQAPRPAPQAKRADAMSEWAQQAMDRAAADLYVPAAELADAFEDAIEHRAAAGTSRWQAASELAGQFPQAYETWKERQRINNPPHEETVTMPKATEAQTFEQARRAYEDAVAAAMQAGLSLPRARTQVARQQPELLARMNLLHPANRGAVAQASIRERFKQEHGRDL